MKVKSILSGTVAVFLAAATAQAASAQDWAGLYVGAMGGYSYSQFSLDNNKRVYHTGVAGGYIGYNSDVDGTVVAGLELAGNYDQYLHLNQENLDLLPAYKFGGSVKMRVGYSLGDLLPYVGVGATVQDLMRQGDNGYVHVPVLSGLAVAGVEYALNNNVSVRAEYNFNYALPENDKSPKKGTNFLAHAVSLGLSYKF